MNFSKDSIMLRELCAIAVPLSSAEHLHSISPPELKNHVDQVVDFATKCGRRCNVLTITISHRPQCDPTVKGHAVITLPYHWS